MSAAGERRRVLLHLGMGKTGSSALQVAFVRNRTLLAGHGVAYPKHSSDRAARRGRVVSGNAASLQLFLRQDVPDDVALERMVRAVSESDAPTVLYSSEFLLLVHPDRLVELRDALDRIGVDLHAVVYVRGVVGHALSSYSQDVKRRLLSSTFSAYIRAENAPGYRLDLHLLEHFAATLGADRLLVLNYDRVRDALIADFWGRALGIHDLTGFDLATEPINRSLTWDEIELMRHTNEHLTSKRQARLVSDALIARPSVGDGLPKIAHADIQLLETRFGALVEKVNAQMSPADRLSIENARVRVVEDEAAPHELSDRERVLIAALCELARQHESVSMRPPVMPAPPRLRPGLRARLRRRSSTT